MRSLTLIPLFFMFACTKIDSHYIIKEGKHHSNRKVVRANNLHFGFTFTEDHKYLHLVQTTQINKLFGLSSGRIHENSARIGWRQEGEKFRIFAYYYLDGVRFEDPIYLAEVNELLIMRVITGDTYYFEVNREIKEVKGAKCEFLCKPYFGGEIPAPKDFAFWIDQF